MNDFLDVPTLIFIGIAIIVLLRLRSVLGTRTGNERPPSERIKEKSDKSSENDNIIPMPHVKNAAQKAGDAESEIADKKAERRLIAEFKKFANGDASLEQGFKEINELDASFTPKSFLGGAKSAYEMIVTAFANGDQKTLKNLLEKDVFEGFQSAIKQREKAGYKVDFTFVGLPKVEFSDARIENSTAMVTIRFFAEVVSATRDASGNLIEGNGDQVANIADSWTFARNVKSRDPNWKLMATDQLD